MRNLIRRLHSISPDNQTVFGKILRKEIPAEILHDDEHVGNN